MKRVYIANWKMQMTEATVKSYLTKIKKLGDNRDEIILAPSFTYLPLVKKSLMKSKIKLAAQDVAAWEKGAFTGEVSASMLKEQGVTHVLIGHSERRFYLHEDDTLIASKIEQAMKSNLTPIFCIGESLEEKRQGKRDSILSRQIRVGLSRLSDYLDKKIILAYEPVWAIGTGEIVTPFDMDDASRIIKRSFINLFSEDYFHQQVKVVYGGSVKSDNVATLKEREDLAGFLVGGASLDPVEFAKIIKA